MCKLVFGVSRQETLDLGFVLFDTGQQSVRTILRELILRSGFDPVTPGTKSSSRFCCRLPPTTTLHLKIVHAILSHLDLWPHGNLMDRI